MSVSASGSSTRAPLVEVFASIQGEGRHAGLPMAFVRVAVCPIRCTYCDTPGSYRASPRFPVRVGAEERSEPNPVTSQRAAALAVEAARANRFGAATWVSLTGGEPLLYPGFARALGADLRVHGLRLFLETAALDSEALARCIDACDHLSLDYKLPGTLAAGDAVQAGAASAACVALAAGRMRAAERPTGVPPSIDATCAVPPTVDVKMILTDAVEESAFDSALERLDPWRDDFLLFLQPVTPFGAVTRGCPKEQVARFAALGAEAGFSVRVLPQIHKLLGVE